MKTEAVEAPIVTFSVRLYRVLLMAYPARFRREYGPHMLQVFRDRCLHAARDEGTNGMSRFWALTLLDLTHSAVQQHLQQEAYMSRAQLIRVSGLALMLGSLPYVIQNISLGAWLIGSVLLAAGILGLRARYGMSAGAFGRSILLAGVIGMFLLYAVLAVLYVGQTYLGWMRFEGSATFNPNGLWIVPYGGSAFPLVALTLFGAAALGSRPMPHFNWLPLASGIWFPMVYGYAVTFLLTHPGARLDQGWNILGPMLFLQFITLCLLGLLLIFERVQELAPA